MEFPLPRHTKVIRNYTLVYLLGTGNYGEVYSAKDNDNNDLVIKIGRGDPNAEQEANFLKLLSSTPTTSKYVPPYHGFFYENGESILVMGYIEGEALIDYANNRDKPIKYGILVSIISQLLAGLYAIHSLGIAHRDIKLDNLIITPTNRVIFIDFGFACSNENECSGYPGTLSYYSPEGLIIDYEDKRSNLEKAQSRDIWALGITCFALANLKYPLDLSGKPNDIGDRIIAGEISKSQSTISFIDKLIDSMLIYDYKSRPNIDALYLQFASTIVFQ